MIWNVCIPCSPLTSELREKGCYEREYLKQHSNYMEMQGYAKYQNYNDTVVLQLMNL